MAINVPPLDDGRGNEPDDKGLLAAGPSSFSSFGREFVRGYFPYDQSGFVEHPMGNVYAERIVKRLP